VDGPGLFELPSWAAVEPEPKVSADRRRTLRQAATLARGYHPLGPKLHAQAAPADDRRAPGRRCGNCWYHTPDGVGGVAGTYPKCWFGGDERGAPRASRGPGTDCRAWWPACVDHTWADPKVSEDAARCVPPEEE
jgi:hypothetical protein